MPALLTSIPNALADLVGLLSSSQEFIQTEALHLLIRVAKGRDEIQKVVGFEGGMEQLLGMAINVGVDGGVLVERALQLLLVLLDENASNMALFCEGGLVLKLQFLLGGHGTEEPSWDGSRMECTCLVLKVLACLLDRQAFKLAQSIQAQVMQSKLLLHPILGLALQPEIPNKVATEALNTLTWIFDGSPKLQDTFAALRYGSNQEPVLNLLIASALSANISAGHTLAQLLKLNPKLQLGIASTFTPPPPTDDDIAQASAGSLIVSSIEQDTPFIALHLLSAVLYECSDAKTIALNYKVEDGETSLLQHLTFRLLSTPKTEIQLQTSLLALFCTWFDSFPAAVAQFLAQGSTINLLLELMDVHLEDKQHERLLQGMSAFLFAICLVNSDAQDLLHFINTRIGRQIFEGRILRLENISTSIHLDQCFMALVKASSSKLIQRILYPDHKDPIIEALEQRFIDQLTLQQTELGNLRYALQSQDQLGNELKGLRLHCSQLEASLAAREAELATFREGSPADLLEENARLRRQGEALVAQMLAVEAENEELLRSLSLYENQGAAPSEAFQTYPSLPPANSHLAPLPALTLQTSPKLPQTSLSKQTHPTFFPRLVCLLWEDFHHMSA